MFRASPPPTISYVTLRASLRRLLPFAGIALFVAAWQAAVASSPHTLVPTPWQSVLAIVELAQKGLLLRYMVASLFRVTWGYLGALLIAGPLMLGMPHKASDADQMNANLKPVYTQSLITQANGALHTLSAMGTQMQTKMLPELATQLNMQPAQLQAFLEQNFPTTAKALNTLPAAMGRFQGLVATFDTHLRDYDTLKPVSFEPIVWMMVAGGIALFLLGGAGVLITRRQTEVHV